MEDHEIIGLLYARDELGLQPDKDGGDPCKRARTHGTGPNGAGTHRTQHPAQGDPC